MSGFKLLAIRPLEGCPSSILKVLEPDMVYLFCNNYKVVYTNAEDKSSDILSIEKKSTPDIDLYSSKNLKINISAVVGKNGSGKSSLMDLFFLFCYAISVKKELIKGIKSFKLPEQDEGVENRLEYINSLVLYRKLKCEVYFEVGIDIVRVRFLNDTLSYEKLNKDGWSPESFKFENYFYSVAINYSLYGLNSKHNHWVNYLFHKNDGYQIPLVINPFRREGNINVNSELHLAQSRTLLNLANVDEEYPTIINDKKISEVQFTMDLSGNDSIPFSYLVNISFWNILKYLEEKELDIFVLFNKLSNPIAGFELNKSEIHDLEKIVEQDKNGDSKSRYFYKDGLNPPRLEEIKFQFVKYVLNKLIKICINYSADVGLQFDKKDSEKEKIQKIVADIDIVIKKVVENKTHITLKLRQALYTIKGKFFHENQNWKCVQNSNDTQYLDYILNVNWKDVSSLINNTVKKNKKDFEEMLELVPGAFIKPNLIIGNFNNDAKSYSFNNFSSGEQQLSHTIQTIGYHLYNINSVHATPKEDKVAYNYINILLDEIELYFHPEFQRGFISNLLKMLHGMKVPNFKGINIIFSTHSPFILSDIPSQNILRLKDGKIEPYKENEQTFGANIHSLLANDFFLENGFMGEFANEYIDNLIIEIQSYKGSQVKMDFEKYKDLLGKISIVGEPFIKQKLYEKIEKYYPSSERERIQRLIESKKKEIEELEKLNDNNK